VSAADWRSAYWRDLKGTPIDGRSYIRGTRPVHGDVVAVKRHLEKILDATEEEVRAVVNLRTTCSE
jgi:hypothetical protein